MNGKLSNVAQCAATFGVAQCAATFGVALLPSLVHSADTSCFLPGKIYNDPVLSQPPNGAFVLQESMCQQSCQTDIYCKQWVWKASGDSSKGLARGGCWKLSGQPALEDVSSSDTVGRVVSGPKTCKETSTLGGTDGMAANDSITGAMNSTASTAKDTVEGSLGNTSMKLPGAAVNITSNITNKVTNDTNSFGPVVPPYVSGSVGFPWWAIILLVLGAIVLVGLLMYLCSAEGKAKKKKAKRSVKAAKQEAVEEDLPLLISDAAAPVAPLVASAEQTIAPVLSQVTTNFATQRAPPAAILQPQQTVLQQPVYSFGVPGMQSRNLQYPLV